MRNPRQEFYTDPDYLAEGFLFEHFIWDSGKKSFRDAGDYTLRHWRGQFYRWVDGCYVRVSDDEIRLWVKRFLHGTNENVRCLGDDGEQHIRITGQLIANVLLCIAGTEHVHIPETYKLNCWMSGIPAGPVIAFHNGLVCPDIETRQAGP